MARNRLNDWHVQTDNAPYLRKLGFRLACGTHDAQFLFIDPAAPYPYNHPRFPGDDDKPADPYPVSDQYQDDRNKDGKLSRFEAHRSGTASRVANELRGSDIGAAPTCARATPTPRRNSPRATVQALIDGTYQGADVVNFWALDGGKWCQCEKCKALGIPPTGSCVWSTTSTGKSRRRSGSSGFADQSRCGF